MSHPRCLLSLVAAVGLLSCAPTCLAHFGTLIPSDDIVAKEENKKIQLDLKFLHPMEGHYMEMEKPRSFGVMHKGERQDLLASLIEAKGKSADQDQDFTFWQTTYQIKRPGDYTFYMEPAPYWEPAEDSFIVHYTKVCVNALGLEAGWDEPVGLETEIIPLTRPYGLWTGNVFTGQVLLKGKPVAGAEIEVEYLNESVDNPSQVHPPADPYVTQVIKADGNGVFTYAMPRTGWWGFAALSEAEWTLPHEGSDKGVEIGAVYWVHTVPMP